MYEMDKNARTIHDWGGTDVPAGGTEDAFRTTGEGVINRIWCTYSPADPAENARLARALIITLYWDGSTEPAVSAPIGDFFGQPVRPRKMENHFFVSSGAECVFSSMVPMPFRTEARIEITNHSPIPVSVFVGVDGEQKPVSDTALYLHGYWQKHTDVGHQDAIDYLPPVTGRGRYLGSQWALIQPGARSDWPWYTRPVTIALDDESASIRVPSIDDFVCSAWWSHEREHLPYESRFTGRPLVETDADGVLTVAMYRFHVPDPVWFTSRISASIGEHEDSHSAPFRRLPPEPAEWSTMTYFYLDRPVNGLQD